MTRDEAIAQLATTTALDFDTARRCVEAMPDLDPDAAVRIATRASVDAYAALDVDPVRICAMTAARIDSIRRLRFVAS